MDRQEIIKAVKQVLMINEHKVCYSEGHDLKVSEGIINPNYVVIAEEIADKILNEQTNN